MVDVKLTSGIAGQSQVVALSDNWIWRHFGRDDLRRNWKWKVKILKCSFLQSLTVRNNVYLHSFGLNWKDPVFSNYEKILTVIFWISRSQSFKYTIRRIFKNQKSNSLSPKLTCSKQGRLILVNVSPDFRWLTYNFKISGSLDHWIRVDLTHVPSAIRRLNSLKIVGKI